MGNSNEKQELQNSSKRVFHVNTHGLKAPPVVYEPYSVAGSKLMTSELSAEDMNDYIHTKLPRLTGTERYSRGEDYATETFISLITQPTDQQGKEKTRRFPLKMDNPHGVSAQVNMSYFDYQKKLTHFINLPKKDEN